MPAIPDGPLSPEQARHLHGVLRERLARQVAIEVWTRDESGFYTGERDTGAHGPDALRLMRQLKSLHPALTLTPYDIEQNAAGAAERGVEESPTVIMRCGGRTIRMVGLFFGPFFQGFLDQLIYLSQGETPLNDGTREVLAGVETEVKLEAFLSAFDPISTRMLPLLGALAVEGRKVRVTEIESSQFPVMAGKRLVSQVPLLVINGQRFVGHYAEAQLAAQILRVSEGSTEPVIRDRVLATPYISEDEARRMSEASRAQGPTGPMTARAPIAGEPGSAPPGSPGSAPGSGLYIPGRG